MAEIKTRPTGDDVTAFLDSVPDEQRRTDAVAMLGLMERVSGAPAEMWGSSIVGFGRHEYTNTSGTSEMMVIGFAPRKAALVLYGVHDDGTRAEPLLEQLGPHTTGKGCLYLKRLDRLDSGVLEELVQRAWDRLSAPERSATREP